MNLIIIDSKDHLDFYFMWVVRKKMYQVMNTTFYLFLWWKVLIFVGGKYLFLWWKVLIFVVESAGYFCGGKCFKQKRRKIEK